MDVTVVSVENIEVYVKVGQQQNDDNSPHYP